MSVAAAYPHITTNAAGEACLAGTRYTVLHLAGEHFHYGWTAEELMRQHLDLRPEEVYAALAYFYDHYDSLTAALHEIAAAADHEHAQPVSRKELLKRRSQNG